MFYLSIDARTRYVVYDIAEAATISRTTRLYANRPRLSVVRRFTGDDSLYRRLSVTRHFILIFHLCLGTICLPYVTVHYI